MSNTILSSVTITDVRFEHRRDTLGIGVSQPRLSWRIETQRPNWLQAAYQILLTANGQIRADTGRVESQESVLVAWPFAPLHSRERAHMQVRVWGTDGSESGWSAAYKVEIGLLNPEDWRAKFIAPAWDEDRSVSQPVPMLRHDFTVKPHLTQARLYVTALGLYQAQINGQLVAEDLFAPGWTSYKHQLHYQTYDVTAMLQEGKNALGAMIGDGWYCGWLGFGGGWRNIYGDRSALLAQLELMYADGTTDYIVSDEQWRAMAGPILSSGIYEGENYDARLEIAGWANADFDDAGWSGVKVMPHNLATLTAPSGPPVRRTEYIKPVAIFKSPSGRTLIDFGQNLVGWLRIRITGEAGQTITLRHAEVLENGELGTRPLRRAQATDHYTLRGAQNGAHVVEIWEPHFTFHGFRYAEVSGWQGDIDPDDITAVVIHSDLERTGWFECSEPLVNKLHDNVVWSMRGNFFSIPTDCPQRDERLGWTGDIQVFAPTASFLYQVEGFLQSWLRDLAAEQKENQGIVSVVVPNILRWPVLPTAAWSDAAPIIPWVLYQRYGDIAILRDQFESMRTWVDVVQQLAGESLLWNHGLQLGDWLDPAAPPDRPSQAQTDRYLVACACFARSTELVGQAATVLGLHDEAAHYLALAAKIRQAFAKEYITPAGRLVNDAQTAYAMAIEYGLLLSPDQRAYAAERLVDRVRANDFRIGTGFVGTPIICDALSNTGNHAAAYELLLQRECPSWLYPVTMGATTVWERWDSMLPDGSINPGEMTSFNHYALGAVADWLHRVVGGIAPAAPGYRHITIAPRPGGGITHAVAKFNSPYGLIVCHWAIQAGQIEIHVTVPPNTQAYVHLPGKAGDAVVVGSGTYHWHYAYTDATANQELTADSTLDEYRAVPRVWSRMVKAILATIKDYIMTQAIAQADGKMTLRHAVASVRNPEAVLAAVAAVVEQQ